MSNFSDQLDEIKTLLSSNINKAFAYSTLLHLQEQSSNTQASIQILAESCQSLIPLIVADVHEDDEEMYVEKLTSSLSRLAFVHFLVDLVVVALLLENEKEKILIDSGFAFNSAAQALKCLGFMIYHPSLVVPISGMWSH